MTHRSRSIHLAGAGVIAFLFLAGIASHGHGAPDNKNNAAEPLRLDVAVTTGDPFDPANEAKIPASLPVLMITGEADPVSEGARTVRELEARYRAGGIKDVTALYYPDARHELLNEINRDEVERAVGDWIDRVTGRT